MHEPLTYWGTFQECPGVTNILDNPFLRPLKSKPYSSMASALQLFLSFFFSPKLLSKSWIKGSKSESQFLCKAALDMTRLAAAHSSMAGTLNFSGRKIYLNCVWVVMILLSTSWGYNDCSHWSLVNIQPGYQGRYILLSTILWYPSFDQKGGSNVHFWATYLCDSNDASVRDTPSRAEKALIELRRESCKKGEVIPFFTWFL